MRKVLVFQLVGALVAGALVEGGSASPRFLARFLQKDAEDVEKDIEHASDEDEAKEAEEEEALGEEEDNAAVEAKNLESEIKYAVGLASEDQREENAGAAEKDEPKQPGCAVAKSGKLNVAKDPSDILTTVPQVVAIGKDKLIGMFEGREDAPTMMIPLIEIKTPIETLVRTQKCFRLFHKKKAYAFCAETTKDRDEWVADLYKAVFCINSGASPTTKVQKKEAKGEDIKLPSRSTKMERYMKQLEEQNEEAVKQAQAEDSPNRKPIGDVEEIQIVGSLGSSPQLTVNGDPLTLPHAIKAEEQMNEGNMEF